jgi:hypothetical protein
VAAVAGALVLAGCGSGGTPSASDTPSGPTSATAAPTTAPTSPSPSRTPKPTKKPKPKPRHFSASVRKITKKSQVKHSWHAGCPVSLSGLRMIEMTYHGMDGEIHTGRLVVAAPVAHKVISVFRTLFHEKYPIRRMKPVDAYGGSDYKSIDADNTSAFNCRNATGSSSWSEHAYGKAIDLNPCENPYVYANGTSDHKHCRKYNDRSRHDRGLIHSGDDTVDAFAAIGWGWGGVWSGDRDYQHFSESGR